MNSQSSLFLAAVILAATTLAAPSAKAQLDRVYPDSGASVSGTITEMTKDSITVKTNSGEEQIPANEIRKVVFNRDPTSLSRARDLYLDAQYDSALEELRGVDVEQLDRAEAKADALFYRAAAAAQLALQGNGDKRKAAAALQNAGRSNANNWHYYEIARLLGDLALALGSTDAAVRYYGVLGSAPFDEYILEGKYLEGWAQLRNRNYEAAEKRFGDVVAANANSQEAIRLRKLAQAGRAQAVAAQGNADQALAEIDKMIEENDPTDIELFARLYNARGAALESKNDFEGAILAYLATHLMFSAQPDAHVEALRQLVELWPKIDKPERAAEFRAILERLYPGVSN